MKNENKSCCSGPSIYLYFVQIACHNYNKNIKKSTKNENKSCCTGRSIYLYFVEIGLSNINPSLFSSEKKKHDYDRAFNVSQMDIWQTVRRLTVVHDALVVCFFRLYFL